MRILYKRSRIVLFFVCLTLYSQFLFAQDIQTIKSDIYSKLRDRRCTTMSLDKCDCPDAREMKAYIDALLEMGINKEEIFYKVAKKFSLNTILDKQIKLDVEKRLIKEVGSRRAQIILEPASFDFCQVSKGKNKISKLFKLTNKGSDKLIIKNIRALCGCTAVSLKIGKNKSPYFDTKGAPDNWQAQLRPNESGELEIVLDLNHPSVGMGKLIREILITSNDPLYPEVTVRIEAEVKD